MTPDTTVGNVNLEIKELRIQRLTATGEKLSDIESKIAALTKEKVGAGGRHNAMRAKMHKAAEGTEGIKIIGINDD